MHRLVGGHNNFFDIGQKQAIGSSESTIVFAIKRTECSDMFLNTEHLVHSPGMIPSRSHVWTSASTRLGTQYFSRYWTQAAYWQVEVSKNNRTKTAFASRHEFSQITRILFGLKDALGNVQRPMDVFLSSAHWQVTIVYLHGIEVISKSAEAHIKRFRTFWPQFNTLLSSSNWRS